MFIEIHNKNIKDNNNECFVNVEQISYIIKLRDGTAQIRFSGESLFSSIETVESYDKVKAMIGVEKDEL